MVSIAERARPRRPIPRWHRGFLVLLPRICHYARFAFRGLDPESKQEAVQSVVAGALNAYVALVRRGKADVAYATPLAMYAIRQYRDGRRLGSRLNVRDVSSPYAQQAKGIVMERLDKYDRENEVWEEILIPDRTCTPAELAASRIDFPAWLKTLKRRDRRIALKLGAGETTGRVAQMFHLSEGRVSQVRRELAESWRRFVGEQPDTRNVWCGGRLTQTTPTAALPLGGQGGPAPCSPEFDPGSSHLSHPFQP